MPKVSAIVLAAGLSSRMGKEDKLFLNYKGKYLVQWVIDEISRSYVNEIILVANDSSITKLKAFENDMVRLVENKSYKSGMTSSIQTGVKNSNDNSDGYMICLGDQPKINSKIYNSIIHSFEAGYSINQKTIAVPFFNSEKGNPIIFSKYYRDEILSHKNPEGCRKIVQNNSEHITSVTINSGFILEDIDTPEDFRNLIT